MSNLQAYLGADNPDEIKYNVQYFPEEECYWICIGICPIEKISCCKELLDYKMMIGRLFNAGYRPSKIKEAFGHDFRTIKRWANALLCDDIHEVIKAFEGRSCDAKLSLPLVRYVQQKYLQIKNTVYNYRQQIAKEIQSLFDQTLSTETLRKLFRQADLLAETQEPEIPSMEESTNSDSIEIPLSDSATKTAQNRSITCSEEENPCVNLIKSSKQSTQNALISPIPTGLSRTTQPRKALQHVGMIFFSAFFDSYAQNRPDLAPAELQWLAQILQGAVNIEQSRQVNLFDLTQFTGKLPIGINSQREELHRVADIQRVIGIYQANNSFIKDGPNNGEIFYYDPTSKEYTGMHKTMKGWCGSSHGISKVMYLDAVHTESGRPCFLQHYSPYNDLRERFFTTLELFDQLFHPDKCQKRTFVIDRGIYGKDAFKRFKASGDYVLTWEKNYKKGAWDKEKVSITFTKTRNRNTATDQQEYHFSCQESQWEKLEGMRRIIVLATNPKGRTVELSILCSNPALDIKKATWLMFNRWLQENDFKYLNKHFGLDQITSYKMKDFTEESIDDKEVVTAEYRELKKAKSSNETAWRKLLLKSQKNEEKSLKLQNNLKKATTKKEQKSLQGKLKTTEKNAKKYEEKLAEHSQKDEEYIEEISSTLMKKSKLSHLIENDFLQHDTRAKATMDALRITASNMFNLLVQHFRPLYKNYRNDHAMLRLLTQSDGFIEVTENQTIIYLWIKGSFQQHQLKIFEQFLNKMAHSINQYFSDRIKPLKLVIFKGDFS